MCSLQVNSLSFDMISKGRISHLIVCKEEGIEQGDKLSLIRQSDNSKCLVKVEYIDCEGSGVDEDYCILKVRALD